jgi:hypothetical protein
MEKENIEKRIEFYDKVSEAYGVLSEKHKAGEEMKKIGLISKAIQYYIASGQGYSEDCEQLEKLVGKPENEIKKETREKMHYPLNDPEQQKRRIFNLVVGELQLPKYISKEYLKLILNETVGIKN